MARLALLLPVLLSSFGAMSAADHVAQAHPGVEQSVEAQTNDASAVSAMNKQPAAAALSRIHVFHRANRSSKKSPTTTTTTTTSKKKTVTTKKKATTKSASKSKTTTKAATTKQATAVKVVKSSLRKITTTTKRRTTPKAINKGKVTTTKKKRTTTKKKTTTTKKPSSPNKGSANTGSMKRGLAYNNAKYTTYFGKSSNSSSQVSWTYNWYLKACGDGTYNCGYNRELEYVPMLWSNASDLLRDWPAAAQAAIDNGTTALMSFNEPDLCLDGAGSSCMTVASAVKTWKKYIQPFAGKAKLGLPAVTNGGAPMGLTWLKKFIAQCDGCTFDFVNLHWYSNVYAGAVYFESYVNSAREVADGLPIWVTEYGLTNEFAYTQAQLNSFIQTTSAWMDQQPDIARYSYFFASTGYPYLVSSDGSRSSGAGDIYNTYRNTTKQPNLYA